MRDCSALARISGTTVSRETIDRLGALETLVQKWTQKINLIAKSTVGVVWERHILDSAQLLPIAPAFRHWVDIGSGAGFPGLVIAVLVAEQATPPRVTLVESDARKAAFLSTVQRELRLNVEVRATRAESVPPLDANVLSARAFASLPMLLPLAARHLAPGGTAIFPKGARVATEVEEARRNCRFDLTTIPSITDPKARILKIERPVCA